MDRRNGVHHLSQVVGDSLIQRSQPGRDFRIGLWMPPVEKPSADYGTVGFTLE